jgi:hypothetical protein
VNPGWRAPGRPNKRRRVKEKGGRIKKEEQGFPVVFWKWIEVEDHGPVSGKK